MRHIVGCLWRERPCPVLYPCPYASKLSHAINKDNRLLRLPNNSTFPIVPSATVGSATISTPRRDCTTPMIVVEPNKESSVLNSSKVGWRSNTSTHVGEPNSSGSAWPSNI